MNTLCLTGSLDDNPPLVVPSNDSQIRASVRVLMDNVQPPPLTDERRRDLRVAYPYPVHLLPLGNDNRPCGADPIVVLGKHLSERGLDFYHREPLPYKRMLASFECGNGRWIGLVLSLSWCRFNRFGWYDNGGRFLQVCSSPLNEKLQRVGEAEKATIPSGAIIARR